MLEMLTCCSLVTSTPLDSNGMPLPASSTPSTSTRNCANATFVTENVPSNVTFSDDVDSRGRPSWACSAVVASPLMVRKSVVSAVMVIGPRMLSPAVCTTTSAGMIGLEVTLLQMTLGHVLVNHPTWKVGLRHGYPSETIRYCGANGSPAASAPGARVSITRPRTTTGRGQQ